MLSSNVGNVVYPLVNVLRIALWRKPVRSKVASEFVYFHVRKIHKAAGHHQIGSVEPRIRRTKIVNHVVRNRPSVSENNLPGVRTVRSEKLFLRLRRIEVWCTEPVIEK